jgi:acetolactate synthase I/II/III large subunit
MKGADYIAETLARHGVKDVFLITGGACAFMVDAISRHAAMRYFCFQHEQAAAMAADAVWRVDGSMGATMATSGPGATNLLTGIACSYFDSIPSIHITGQVNLGETKAYGGAKVRQAGFQETKIVEMARPITKYAAQVHDAESLRREMAKALYIANSGRKGPVLIDVPMDVQQIDVGDTIEMADELKAREPSSDGAVKQAIDRLDAVLKGGQRPLVLFGAGVGLASAEKALSDWLQSYDVPFVASWNGLTYFDHDMPNYLGQIGVYGNRGANFVLQNADVLVVFGSRLDNRQRSGNAKNFAPAAKVLVIDIDAEELRKYATDGYATSELDLKDLPKVLEKVKPPRSSNAWREYVGEMKSRFFGRDISTAANAHQTMSPYGAVQKINGMIERDAIVVADCGANLCWVYQIFHRTNQVLMTAGGHSPMGYSIPAAIGAAIRAPERQVVCFIGDGGFQINLQELQTIRQYNLNITIVVMNNHGYGIIKQFQDSYLGSRYEASGKGYGMPDLAKLSQAYGLDYVSIDKVEDIDPRLFVRNGARLVDLQLHPHTLIEPRLEMGRPINDQSPYADRAEFAANNRFVPFENVAPPR